MCLFIGIFVGRRLIIGRLRHIAPLQAEIEMCIGQGG
jgi:hypothetical protein